MIVLRPRLSLLMSLLAMGACNCDEAGVGSLVPLIEVDPVVIDFGALAVGVQAQSAVTIRNVGDSTLHISAARLTGDTVFAIDGEVPNFLPPSSSTPVVLTARPTEIGTFNGFLEIDSDGLLTIDSPGQTRSRVKVALRVRGVAAPPCDDGNVCTDDWFDTAANGCKHSFADGRTCESADRCIIDAVCNQGVCLGRSKTCADNSPCTRDLCRQIDGECLFLTDENACDDDNPCTADLCSDTGCSNEPVANGSPCDDGDQCTQADSCFAGACVGTGVGDGNVCNDNNSCTINDTCFSGVCTGESIIDLADEGDVVFEYDLTAWDGGFLHRREVSLSDDGVLYALDHLPLTNPQGLTHVVSTMKQCGTEDYEFAYRPPDSFVLVRFVRREMQLQTDNTLRIVVGVRQLPDNGYQPQTTSYVLDKAGNVLQSRVRAPGGETGRSLLPDGSHIYGVVWPLTQNAPTPDNPARQNLVVVREDLTGQVLWRHERSSLDWAEFLGVAGPRVLFWSENRFGALDFNTGATVWTADTQHITKEMAYSTALNLGVTRVGNNFGNSQVLGVEILEGNQVFLFPAQEDLAYLPRTDPVIGADGRIMLVMQRSSTVPFQPTSLEWLELSPDGAMLSSAPLPYFFPDGWDATRIEDDPSTTVAEDGIAYVGYGDQFWAINPGGGVRWTVTSTYSHGFTGTVPVLRDDGILLVSDGHRRILGIKTNGAKMSDAGWPTFRHDGRRTNFTP